MIINPIKTRVITPPKDDLLEAIRDVLPSIKERSIIAITSKVVSIWQGRCVPKAEYPNKDELIKKEADKYLPRDFVPNRWVMHTVKENLFVPSTGIDESNANNFYVLWPDDPKKTAKKLWQWARKTYKVKNVGIVITDSHTIPLRRGTLGISLAHYGFSPLKDYRGKKDIFGRKFVIQVADIADGLAASAVLVIGEGKETTPIAIISDVPFVRFIDRPYVSRKPFSSFEIEEKEDLYYALLSPLPWEKGGGGIS